MRHLPIILRQLRRASNQAILFVLCVALSLSALTAFSGFGHSVDRALHEDARKLHTADILIRSYDPISAPLEAMLARFEGQRKFQRANIHQFYSVVRPLAGGDSVLSALKVVDTGYPFYGDVTLASGRTFQSILIPGTCIVERALLDRTGLKVGQRLKVGFTDLRIADIVTAEPDRSLNLFSLGPRVFIHSADLEALGLVATGGRIRRMVLLKMSDPGQTDTMADQLRRVSQPDQESVDTYRTAATRIKRFMDNFLFFLKLVGLFILMIAGLGIQGTLTALIAGKRRTVAIMKAVGATGKVVMIHFMTLLMLLGGLGTLLGLASGWMLQHLLGMVVAPLIADELPQTFSWGGLVEGIMLGFAVVALFSVLPLYRLKAMRPIIIFRRETAANLKRWPYLLSGTLFIVFFSALVIRHMGDLRFGLYFVGAMILLVCIAAAMAQMILLALKRWRVRHLTLRQAIRGLFRRGNATRAVMITLTGSLGIIFATYLIEKNLDATFVQSYPRQAPNAYFIDIQKDQAEAFSAAVEREVDFYPIVRARITAINDNAIDRNQERHKRRDNFSRVFNLTYRHHLLNDESLLQGDAMFHPDWGDHQVSILDTVAEMGTIKVGDTLSFRIQGVPLQARVSSIRTRARSAFSPFFYFVFPEKVLGQAPQTLFAALQVPASQLGPLQNRIVESLPNISVIDMTRTIEVFARLMGQLSSILRAFSLFSIGAGLLILISAVLATRAERIMESVYFKVLGAGKGFIFTVFALENLLIGLCSSVAALTIAHAGAYFICTTQLDIGYRPFLPASLSMVALTLVMVLGVGMWASRSIISKKPVVYLREQTDG